jgi:hypothetical protein
MDWYYVVGENRNGPVGEEELQRLVQQGVILPQTLVWREGMANWEPYGGRTPPPIYGAANIGDTVCAGCGRSFPSSEVISLTGGVYCAACKPRALQQLREGATATTAVEEMRKTHLNREASVKSIGLLYYLGGVGLFVAGIGTVSRGAGAGGEEILISALFFLLGVAQIWWAPGCAACADGPEFRPGYYRALACWHFPLEP